jgi:hypothetical protein
VTVPVPPKAENAALEEPRVTVQAVPAWFTVKVWPPMVAVSAREEAPLLVGIATVTIAPPNPVEGVALRPEAVHWQLAPEAETAMEAGPPAEGTVKLEGLIEKEQPGPNCWIL